MKRAVIVLLVLGVVVVLTGCSGEDNVYSGRIEATQVDIQPEVSGKLLKVYVSQGDLVEKGQLLAELDKEAAEIKLKQAQGAVESAEAKLAEALSGSRDKEIKAARAQVKNVEAQLEQAKQTLEYYRDKAKRYKQLMETGAISQQRYEDIQHSLKQALSGVKALESSLDKARYKLQLLEEGSTTNYIQSLRGELKKAEALMEQRKLELEKTQIFSPIDGTVENINFEAGELITAGSSLMTVTDLKNQWVNVYVPQSELGLWGMGDKVLMVADAYPEEEFLGKVVYIASEAEFTPKNVQTKEARMDTVFKVKIQLIEGEEKLRPGMWVDVLRGEGSE